jgi:hypothetical protein
MSAVYGIDTLLFSIPISGCMTHLMSDDAASLHAIRILLGLLKSHPTISQLTLSLYLVIETKLKLNHSMTSLIKELHRVKELHYRLSISRTAVDRLLLALVYRKVIVKFSREIN